MLELAGRKTPSVKQNRPRMESAVPVPAENPRQLRRAELVLALALALIVTKQLPTQTRARLHRPVSALHRQSWHLLQQQWMVDWLHPRSLWLHRQKRQVSAVVVVSCCERRLPGRVEV